MWTWDMNRATFNSCARANARGTWYLLNNPSVTRKVRPVGCSVCRSETPRINTRKLPPATDRRRYNFPQPHEASLTRVCEWHQISRRTPFNNAALHYHRFRERALTYYTLQNYYVICRLCCFRDEFRDMSNLSDVFIRRIIVIMSIMVFQRISWRGHVYLHALGLVYGEAGGAEFPAAYVTRSGAAFHRRGRRPRRLLWILRRLLRRRGRLRLDHLRFILVPVAAKV